MVYVISDIHGCYDAYIELLKKINFSDNDELYVLGDIVDRGPEPVKVLKDMMLRPNVYPILGNHDYMALTVLEKLNVEITEDNVETHLCQKDLMDYFFWMQDGGKTTLERFKELNVTEREDILEYLKDFSVYEVIGLNGKTYICVHADIHNFEATKKLAEYDLADFIFHRANYGKRYYPSKDIFLVKC